MSIAGAECGKGSDYPSRVPETTPGVCWGLCC